MRLRKFLRLPMTGKMEKIRDYVYRQEMILP